MNLFELSKDSCHNWIHLYISCSDEDQIATMLVQAGAKVNSRNNKDVTPLIIAAVKGHVSVMRVLVAQPDIGLSDQVGVVSVSWRHTGSWICKIGHP